MNELLTSQEIAERLRMSARHVSERLSKTDKFPKHYLIGNSKRWDKKEFESWLNDQRV